MGNLEGNEEIVADQRLYRLLEISQKIVELQREQTQILQSLLPNTMPELVFDDQRRRIYWGGGSVKLGKKSYLFVKTVWNGEGHHAEFAELEENVWMLQAETEMFVDRSTVAMLVRHTQKNLTDADFPYKIEGVKIFSSRELEGFRLVFLGNKKNILQSENARMV
jgi:DNA-binding response OmpR family regulator